MTNGSKPTNITPYKHEEEAKGSKSLQKIFETDAQWKLNARKIYAPLFLIFLLVQNIIAYVFIFIVYFQHNLSSVQPFIISLFIGMIVETAYIVKIIIRWVFTDIDYSKHPLNNRFKENKDSSK